MIEHDRIGKYQVLGRIGEGAMGQVYKAFDPLLNRQVAVKTIGPSLAADPEFRRRFQREAQSAAQLNHPNVVTIYDYGEDPQTGLTYMAMELLEGTDLRQAIRSGALRALSSKLQVMRQLCDGLGFAHAHGVLHRDIKPGNIYVQPDGRVKILDFGLARIESSDITRTGMVLGTPNYMSPEQVRGERLDARSDVFSLGVVFYEILTTRRAFEAPSLHDVLQNILEREPEPARRLAPDTPPPLVAVLERALAKDPARRYAEAGEMGRALAAAAEREPSAEATRMTTGDELATTILPAMPALLQPPPLLPSPGSGSRPRSAPPASLRPATARPASGVAPVVARPASTGRSASELASQSPESDTVAPGRSGRLLVVVGASVLVLLLAAGGLAVWLHGTPGASAQAPDQLRMLKDTLIESKLDLARADLDNRDYATAASHAREALSLDPQNTGARQVLTRAEGARHDLDAAVETARSAFARGDLPAARTAVARVLALDPRNAVAGELSARLERSPEAPQERRHAAGAASPRPVRPVSLTRATLPAAPAPPPRPSSQPAPADTRNAAPVQVAAAPAAEPPAAAPQPAPAEVAAANSSPVMPPVLVSQMAPRYPVSAGNLAGSVQLTALVDDKGEVSDVRVLRATPPNVGFEAAAVEHARSRRYRPATQRGVPIATRVAIVVNFVSAPTRP